MPEQFVGESIRPISESIDTTGMSRGDPGLPMRFRWRKREYAIVDVLDTWKERLAEGNAQTGKGEKYTRKHWFRIRTDDGTVMSIYFERQFRVRGVTKRWWVYTVEEPD